MPVQPRQENSCSDGSPVATTNWAGGSKVASWNVLQCEKGVYCCRPSSDTKNCCSNISAVITTDIGTLLLATETATIGTGTAASTVTITAVAGEATESSSNGTSASVSASCSSDKTAVVGGAVGGALGAALLASLGALAFVLTRRKNAAVHEKDRVSTAQTTEFLEHHSKPLKYPDGTYIPPQELSNRERYEMY